MTLNPPKNANYSAVVVRVPRTIELPNCDNVHAVPIFGSQAITQKSVQEGDLMLYFPAEVQLSPEYCRVNNMYRHSELNLDPEAKGYIEDNRRVKAVKFRGHRSDALLMPLSSLCFASDAHPDVIFREGNTFDELNGQEICRKYVPAGSKEAQPGAASTKAKSRVDSKLLPEHFETDNWFRNNWKIEDDHDVVVTQKLHGTSIRVGHVPVARKLSFWERVAKRWFKVQIQETEYDYVFGSRRTIKDANNEGQSHFYDSDIWTLAGRELEGLLPQGYVVYGELIGWTPEGRPIQAGYTYNVPKGQAHLYVYRVAHINAQGYSADLSHDAMVEFCTNLGLKVVPELWRGPHLAFNPEQFLDKRFVADGWGHAVPTDVVDEGVCVRHEGVTPLILKAKSPLFLRGESKALDKGEVGIEELEAA